MKVELRCVDIEWYGVHRKQNVRFDARDEQGRLFSVMFYDLQPDEAQRYERGGRYEATLELAAMPEERKR